MSSSMLTGERRWGAARRGGMTVLGKVAVPKPINLPSQRLENHGLDPSVEIVPKGTAGWGNRSSSSNAWGSTTISPSTDGGSGSPSHLSGRPSSGGSGTRPSTAGSDRASESTASAWGPSPRPSSASGPLISNQSSLASSRPRSAETRPGSSQLSRFAEPLSENPGAWGAAGTTEKLGVASSKRDGFSLTSGDFPTLGSEKDNSVKNNELQEHSSHARPGSSSGKGGPVKERIGTSSVGDVSINDVKIGAVNTWKRGPTYVEDGPRPNVENWRGESQPYLNASIPPQHFEPWHGTPPPGGVWFRGPPGHPYGAPVAPAGFPMEVFPYYRPQIPATALANSQPVPPPGAGPRGPHPKNGDMYRPHMPDAYIRPGMPIRPGFYPGPVYEGYYPPPMGYCSSNERDIPFMGMPAGPSVYERYSNQNACDSNNSHSRTGGYGSSGKARVPEQAETGHPHDNRGPYKVLLKQHNDWDGKDEQKWDRMGTTNASDLEKGDQRKTSWDDDWEADQIKIEELDSRRIKVGGESASRIFDNQIGSSAPVKVMLTECVSSTNAIDDSSTKKFETASSTSPEAPKPSSAAQKDSTLIQKIEGLNAKARASDGRHDAPFVSSREEQKNSLQVDYTKTNQSTKEASCGATYSERIHADAVPIPVSREVGVSTGLGSKDRSSEQVAASGTAISRRGTHGGQSRVDHRGKGRFNAQDVDGWRKKSHVADSSSVAGSSNVELSSNVHMQGCPSSMQAAQTSVLHLQGTEDGESGFVSDPIDSQAQRAKMKEIAKQRAKQLQMEEEERTREQKAKALAKLEELNRRSQTVDCSTQKLVSSGAFQHKQEELQVVAESNVAPSPSVTAQIDESNANKVGDSADLSRELPIEISRRSNEEPIIPNQPLPLQQNANSIDAADNRSSSQMNDGCVSKQKRVGYKQRQNIHKQNIPVEKSLTEKSVSTVTIEMPKSHSDVVVSTVASVELVVNENATSGELNLPVNANVSTESSGHQRRKNSRSGKNKLKLEDTSLPRETNPVKASVENVVPKPSELVLDPSPIESISNSKDATQSSENRGSLLNEEAHGRPMNQLKPQHPRRMPRNPQVNRSVEKFHNSESVIWAPVQPQNKSEVADEVSEKSVVQTVNTLSRGDHQGQNNLKNKRAEMERYVVPKPVAKELAQQGSIQQPTSPSINQTTSDDTIRRGASSSQSNDSAQLAGTAIEKSAFAVESRNGDTKPNRQAKSGLWRQRVPAESTHVEGLQEESSYTSNPGTNVQKAIEHSETLKPDGQSVKSQPKYADDWSTPDGWHTLGSSDSAAAVPSIVVKDQGVAGRGKRHPFKGQKSVGNTHGLDYKNVGGGNTDKMGIPSPPLETGTTVALKENRGAGERSSSHWQPKSQANPVHNQWGGKHNIGQTDNAEVATRTIIRKESTTSHGGADLPPHDKETNHPHTDQLASETGTVIEAPNAGHREGKGEEKNVASLKGHPPSPNQGPVNSVEPASDIRNEQRLSTGFRKNGNHGNRFTRGGHESRGDWSSGGQDNKQLHNQPQNQNRERQRYSSSHYEYQPVGPFSNKRSNIEGASDGSHNNTSMRFRERGHGHSRRGGGNFYGRQSGNARVDAGYE